MGGIKIVKGYTRMIGKSQREHIEREVCRAMRYVRDPSRPPGHQIKASIGTVEGFQLVLDIYMHLSSLRYRIDIDVIDEENYRQGTLKIYVKGILDSSILPTTMGSIDKMKRARQLLLELRDIVMFSTMIEEEMEYLETLEVIRGTRE